MTFSAIQLTTPTKKSGAALIQPRSTCPAQDQGRSTPPPSRQSIASRRGGGGWASDEDYADLKAALVWGSRYHCAASSVPVSKTSAAPLPALQRLAFHLAAKEEAETKKSIERGRRDDTSC